MRRRRRRRHRPTVATDVLQREIVDRLASAGQLPQSVTCAEDLVGEVGMSTV
jgi:hypothetical protein